MLLSGVFFTLMLVAPTRHSAATVSNSTSNSTSNLSTLTPALAATPTGSSHKWGLTNIRVDATFLLLLLFRTSAWLWLNPLFNLLDALAFALIHRVLSSSAQPAKELAPDTGALVDAAGEKQNLKASNDIPLNDMRATTASVADQKDEGENRGPLVVPAPENEPLNAAQQQNCSKTNEAMNTSGPKDAAADIGQQSARAFGLIRSGGSIGFMLMAAAIAIGTRLFVSNPQVLEQFKWLVSLYDVCCLLAVVAFLFYRTDRVSSSVSLFTDLGASSHLSLSSTSIPYCTVQIQC